MENEIRNRTSVLKTDSSIKNFNNLLSFCIMKKILFLAVFKIKYKKFSNIFLQLVTWKAWNLFWKNRRTINTFRDLRILFPQINLGGHEKNIFKIVYLEKSLKLAPKLFRTLVSIRTTNVRCCNHKCVRYEVHNAITRGSSISHACVQNADFKQ